MDKDAITGAINAIVCASHMRKCNADQPGAIACADHMDAKARYDLIDEGIALPDFVASLRDGWRRKMYQAMNRLQVSNAMREGDKHDASIMRARACKTDGVISW